MVVAACCGDASQKGHPGRLVRVNGEVDVAKYREILKDHLFPSAGELWRTFTIRRDDDWKCPAKVTQKCFEDKQGGCWGVAKSK